MNQLDNSSLTFSGFAHPDKYFTKIPHSFFQLMPELTGAETKVMLYVFRHTWGFGEYDRPKKITSDEFVHGRKARNRTRLDKGTGLSKTAVIKALRGLVKRGFLVEVIDDNDKARIKKFYQPSMSSVLTSKVKNIDISSQENLQRSEKESEAKKNAEGKKQPPSAASVDEEKKEVSLDSEVTPSTNQVPISKAQKRVARAREVRELEERMVQYFSSGGIPYTQRALDLLTKPVPVGDEYYLSPADMYDKYRDGMAKYLRKLVKAFEDIYKENPEDLGRTGLHFVNMLRQYEYQEIERYL